MCTEIWFPDEKRHLYDIGALRKLIYPAKPVIVDGYPALTDECCLCPVDVPATAKAAGFECDFEDGCWVWRR